MYAIETEALVKRFGGFTAVGGICLRVPEGSIYGFLGPNGAGKTTTIKMLTGLSKPTSGKIRFFGREAVFGSCINRDNIGYLPDAPGFYDWMTPVEYLEFIGSLYSLRGNILKKRIAEILELVGLADENKKIGVFSKGMKQRLGIAQTLINNPAVIFLDEPTSALDPIGRKEIMDIIARLAGKVTVFFSTHILSDIERVCDRVCILNQGKIIIEDTISGLREKYGYRTILLEIDGNVDLILSALGAEKWLDEAIKINETEIKLKVNSLPEAHANIPRIVAEKGLGLKKLVNLEPTLEDVFVKVVK